MPNVNGVLKQPYACLCARCLKKDRREELGKIQELIKLARGKQSAVTKEQIAKYAMSWDERHGYYAHRCAEDYTSMQFPDHTQPVFLSSCFKCDQATVITLEHEQLTIQKLPQFAKYWGRKGITDLAKLQQKEITCTHCGYKGYKNSENMFAAKTKQTQTITDGAKS